MDGWMNEFTFDNLVLTLFRIETLPSPFSFELSVGAMVSMAAPESRFEPILTFVMVVKVGEYTTHSGS